MKSLLLSYYVTTRWFRSMPEYYVKGTVFNFITFWGLIACGLYCVILGSIPYKFKTAFVPVGGIMFTMFLVDFFFEKRTKKAFKEWKIEQEYKKLSRNQRANHIIVALLTFWGAFALFCYLGVKFIGGYSVK